MDTIINIVIVALMAITIENTIFTRALGTSTLILAAKSKKSIIPFGLSITYICTVSSALSFLADKFLLNKETSFMYKPLVYVIIIGFVYVVALLLLWKFAYSLFISVKKFVHISAFNCAVLGALFLNSIKSHSFLGYISFGLGTGIFIATFLLSACYEKLNSDKVSDSFRGFPATMIYIGILSMAFFALTGSIPKI